MDTKSSGAKGSHATIGFKLFKSNKQSSIVLKATTITERDITYPASPQQKLYYALYSTEKCITATKLFTK